MDRRSQRTEVDQIDVASPCSARWEEMEGDEKVRFCRECTLSVYNLSAMDVEEAAEVIARDDEQLCVRFYRREDGTILTRDCPVGQEERRRKSRRNIVEKVVWTAVGASFAGAMFTPTMGARVRPSAVTMAFVSSAALEDTTRLRSLLDQGIDPNRATASGQTALMYAAANGRVEGIRLLISRGVDVHARNRKGVTALSLAIAHGHQKIVTLLRRAGAKE